MHVGSFHENARLEPMQCSLWPDNHQHSIRVGLVISTKLPLANSPVSVTRTESLIASPASAVVSLTKPLRDDNSHPGQGDREAAKAVKP
jgi:hypothetical protein